MKYKAERLDQYEQRWLKDTTGEFTKVAGMGAPVPMAPPRQVQAPVVNAEGEVV